MLRKLGAYPRQNALATALRELGKLKRTLFLLRYIRDIDLRRRIHIGLNKEEARNALARAVFFNRLGELRDRTLENQQHEHALELQSIFGYRPFTIIEYRRLRGWFRSCPANQ
jgi:TnpA family transposase